MKRRWVNRLAVPQSRRCRSLHLLAEVVGDLVEVARALGEARALGADVGVVKAEERRRGCEHLEGGVGLEPRVVHAVAEPGPLEGLPAERVAALPGEGMPPGDGKAQVILQPLAHHHRVGS
jgi:hypothetical protein